MDPDYNQKNPWCLNSPKMPFFYKDTPKWYLAAKTRDFRDYQKQLPIIGKIQLPPTPLRNPNALLLNKGSFY